MRKVTRRLLPLLLLLTAVPSAAQGEWTVRGDCTPDLAAADGSALARGGRRQLPAINKKWDATKTYRQMVILLSFRDVSFRMENPRETYDSIFNVKGYNQRDGAGCVADYFRQQSAGLFNLKFDVYGPVVVDTLANPYTGASESTRNYGKQQFMDATRQVLEQNPDVDYRVYDWDGDGQVNQVIYVYAGMCGNQGESSYGYIWPNTSTFTSIDAPHNVKISNYTASAELWSNGQSCGIGTICHEFTHSLGLPDVYPTSSQAGYSIVDEWDLMDGGNFTNYGWCPPNYSPLEKMLLGWLTPTELSAPQQITGMKSIAGGGEVYLVRHTADEYLLIENRQWSGWDYGLPGHGLLVWHVDYNASAWSSNTVNNRVGQPRYQVFHADNMDYNAWDTYLRSSGTKTKYRETPRLHCKYLQSSSYPWSADSVNTVNCDLTDATQPATTMYSKNAAGSYQLGKPITRIRETDDGLVAFDFMDETITAAGGVTRRPAATQQQYYDLQGRRSATSRSGLLIVRRNDGTYGKAFVKPLK